MAPSWPPSGVLIRLDLDRAVALHLAHALQAHRAYCVENDYALPHVLDVLARDADHIARTPNVPHGTPDRDGHDHERDGDDYADTRPVVLSRDAFADRAGVTTRTVNRWIAAGRVVCGIPETELDRVKGNRCRTSRSSTTP